MRFPACLVGVVVASVGVCADEVIEARSLFDKLTEVRAEHCGVQHYRMSSPDAESGGKADDDWYGCLTVTVRRSADGADYAVEMLQELRTLDTWVRTEPRILNCVLTVRQSGVLAANLTVRSFAFEVENWARASEGAKLELTERSSRRIEARDGGVDVTSRTGAEPEVRTRCDGAFEIAGLELLLPKLLIDLVPGDTALRMRVVAPNGSPAVVTLRRTATNRREIDDHEREVIGLAVDEGPEVACDPLTGRIVAGTRSGWSLRPISAADAEGWRRQTARWRAANK